MNTPGTFQIHATDGAARTGVLQTAHGPVNTPIFMPVGTVGSVKAIAPDDLNAIGAEIILGNTYHLYLRPGDELVARRGGLHGFNAWDKPILTDSGGFQVFSLSTLRTIKEEGVTFRSHLDGSKHLFTPEKVVSIQRNLNSDIMMVLDECVPAGADHTYTARSLTMTTRWAKRCRDAYPKGTAGNLLFGIVQGGMFKDLRSESARQLIDLDFEGYAIGGLSVGESKDVMMEMLYHTAPILPSEKPRYLMGVGTPLDIIKGIDAGVDMFDCVLPTRNARNGTLYTSLGKLNIKRPDVVQPATGCIDEYIKIITKLLDTGYAYIEGGNVYFDTSKLEKYYIFNEHKEEDLAVGVREGVEEDTNKRNKNDFVLWFTKSKFEDQALKWDSPWGVGYPGWHIECSGISLKYLGEDLDIHCGGIDNAFPHHTNEIAQSESYIGHHWCNYWMHVMHLNTASGKMSKSKGEFLTVSLLEQKGYDPLCYRLFCLQSHYRRNLVFSWENLDNAAGTYQKLLTKIAALKPGDGEIDEAAVTALREKFNAALGNDLNTSLAITALYDVLKYKTNDATKLFVLDDFDKVLSLDLCSKAAEIRKRNAAEKPAAGAYSIFCEDGSDDPAVTAQIQARYDAKKAKNFAEADRIRDELKAQGIEITDIPGGAKWKHI